MKSAIALAFAAAAAALPAPQQGAEDNRPFSGVVIHSGSPIHYASIHANDEQFWLFKETKTYCPPSAGAACPGGRTPLTAFSKAAGTSTLSLDVKVPGGQQCYVDNTGALKFTIAHSANTGEGSLTEGFSISDNHVRFENQDWWACPTDGPNGTFYGIFAQSRPDAPNSGADCTSFVFRAEEVGAEYESQWEYV